MDFKYNDEQKELKRWVREFTEDKLRPIAARVDSMDDVSWDVVKLLADEGLFRYVIPKEYGGVGIDASQICIIREELCRVCIHADAILIASLLGSLPISMFGAEQQKQKYLPALARGEKIAASAMTEPTAGSDLANIQTTATLEGDYYIINGEKSFASNAGSSEVCTVYVKTDLSLGSKGISVFILDTKNRKPGLKCHVMRLMSPAWPVYKLKFENYRIPKENIVSQPGKGMRIALTCLDLCRSSVGAAAVGIAQAAYEEALKYAQQREAFGRPLIDFQATQFKLADMISNISAARLLVFKAASMTHDQEERVTIAWASMAKLFATEMAQRVVDEALQIHGGIGLIRNSRIEQLYRAAREMRIYEGTSEIQRWTIARAATSGVLGD